MKRKHAHTPKLKSKWSRKFPNHIPNPNSHLDICIASLSSAVQYMGQEGHKAKLLSGRISLPQALPLESRLTRKLPHLYTPPA